MDATKYDNIVWINGLPKNVSESDVQSHFSKCGQIVNMLLFTSKFKMSYCFVEFADNAGVQAALALNKTSFNEESDPGHHLIVALTDKNRYFSHLQREERKKKRNEQIEKTIEDKTKFEAYLYGFNEGRKYSAPSRPRQNNFKKNVVNTSSA